MHPLAMVSIPAAWLEGRCHNHLTWVLVAEMKVVVVGVTIEEWGWWAAVVEGGTRPCWADGGSVEGVRGWFWHFQLAMVAVFAMMKVGRFSWVGSLEEMSLRGSLPEEAGGAWGAVAGVGWGGVGGAGGAVAGQLSWHRR